MSNCEVCEGIKASYLAAVTSLHSANVQFRRAKADSVAAAVARRRVNDCLKKLIAAEKSKTSHQAWHMESFSRFHGELEAAAGMAAQVR